MVVAFGLMVTLLFGIALKFASVFTVVLALGLTFWPAVVLVVLRALLAVLPLVVPFVVPLVVLPAVVPLVVLVDCVADVVWFVVPLGLIVTVLCGIALKVASVLTVVLALGVTDWPAVVLVVLVASLVVVWATAAPVIAANTAAAIRLNCLRTILDLL